MTRVPRFVLVVALLTSLGSVAFAEGKTTTDPNASGNAGASSPQPIWATDKRLDQKIEYDAGGARLHRVIEDLARMSGVTIYCGSTPEDWRTRDLPVTVASRGTSLRDLLHFVVYATQTSLTGTKNDKGIITYRITRNSRIQKMIADYDQAVEDYKRAVIAHEFDVAACLKDVPAGDITVPNDADQRWYDRMGEYRALSSLLAAMDAKTKDDIMSGALLQLTPQTAPANLRQPLLDYLKAINNTCVNQTRVDFEKRPSLRPKGTTSVECATLDELEDGRVLMRLDDSGISAQSTVRMREEYGRFVPGGDSSSDVHDIYSYAICAKDRSKFPQSPREPYYPAPDKLPGSTGVWGNFKDYSELSNRKVTIKFEDDKKPKCSADAILAISKAIGRTIVWEDFESQTKECDIRDQYKEELSWWEALNRTRIGPNFVEWSKHRDTGAFVGINSKWARLHKRLMPESLINDLTEKANSDGIGLEDLLPTAAFDEESLSMWLAGETFGGFWTAPFHKAEDRPMWVFYNSLPKWQKEQVKSAAGLPLGKFDAKVILPLLQEKVKRGSASIYFPDAPSKDSLMDPAVFPTLVMRLKYTETARAVPQAELVTSTATAEPAKEPNSEPIKIPESFIKPKHYRLEIEGGDAAHKISVEYRADSIPFFSPKREKELLQALASQKTKATQPAKN